MGGRHPDRRAELLIGPAFLLCALRCFRWPRARLRDQPRPNLLGMDQRFPRARQVGVCPDVVDACEKEGGVPSRLLKTEAGVGRQESTPCQMFAGSPSWEEEGARSRSMISLGRARGG